MKWYSLLFCLIIAAAAFIARDNSSGKAMIDTSKDYLFSLSSGSTEESYMLLSDSLASLVSPQFLLSLVDQPAIGRIRIGRSDNRGYRLSLSLDEGGSRILWLKRDTDGNWRISGDSSLDNLLGRATLMCTEHAQSIVAVAVSRGENPGDYSCPVTGDEYFLDNGMLLCPAGHLGDGMETDGYACSLLRDSLAVVLYFYISSDFPYPESFAEMYEESDGEFGQRGGFRCPDNGYAYYRITDEGVFCPFHEEISPITVPDDSVRNDRETVTVHQGSEAP